VLTSSSDERDVLRSYSNHANAYVTKPVDSPQLVELVSRLDGFWFGVVRLPRGPGG
jgi:CheY-like chemotaxis protein